LCEEQQTKAEGMSKRCEKVFL